MRKVLVIGNGFDLYHKLPTRYTDFLLFMNKWNDFKEFHKNATIEVKENNVLDIVRTDKGELKYDSITDFAKYKNAYSEEALNELDLARDNKWIEYFNEVIASSCIGKNWIDFEQEILNALLFVQEYFELLPRIAGTKQIVNNVASAGVSRVLRVFVQKSPKAISLPVGIVSRSDLRNIDEKKEALLNYMKEELDKLNKCLNIYLLEFVTRIKCEHYSEQIKDLDEIHLINFNYTYTYKYVYGGSKLKQHHAIHGDAQEHNMVLGIPDEAFSKTTEYIYFQKYFQRIQKRTGNYYKRWITKPKNNALEDTSVEVYIMGHSLAESDKGILKDIFKSDYVKMITIYYHSQKAFEDMIINLVKMFGQDFVIEQTSNNRIVFAELKDAVVGTVK